VSGSTGLPTSLADDAEGARGSKMFQLSWPENAQACFRLEQRIAFACDGLDERGFSGAVWAEDGDVLAGFESIGWGGSDGVCALDTDVFSSTRIGRIKRRAAVASDSACRFFAGLIFACKPQGRDESRTADAPIRAKRRRRVDQE
jgi:hypothetical protein